MGNFPIMTDAMEEWMNAMTFKVVTKTVANFQSVETTTATRFQGVLYPMPHQQLLEKPEGQRAWKWWTLITSFNLKVEDIVIDSNDVQYRVSTKADYSSAGFNEYTIQQDWTT